MKDNIFNSALRLFSEKGYDNTNMDDVADDADVTKETLYYHFQSKSQLFIETIIRYERQLEEKVVEFVSAENDPDIISFNITKLCVDFFTDYKYIADIVMSEIQVEPDAAAEIKKVKNHFSTLISYLIDEGIANGKLRNCNSRITAGSMIYYTYTYCSLMRESGTYDKTAVAARINDLLMNGMKK
ncbi:MAG: TetR family transcriptional regulator [Eubacteriales bacterium]